MGIWDYRRHFLTDLLSAVFFWCEFTVYTGKSQLPPFPKKNWNMNGMVLYLRQNKHVLRGGPNCIYEGWVHRCSPERMSTETAGCKVSQISCKHAIYTLVSFPNWSGRRTWLAVLMICFSVLLLCWWFVCILVFLGMIFEGASHLPKAANEGQRTPKVAIRCDRVP